MNIKRLKAFPVVFSHEGELITATMTALPNWRWQKLWCLTVPFIALHGSPENRIRWLWSLLTTLMSSPLVVIHLEETPSLVWLRAQPGECILGSNEHENHAQMSEIESRRGANEKQRQGVDRPRVKNSGSNQEYRVRHFYLHFCSFLLFRASTKESWWQNALHQHPVCQWPRLHPYKRNSREHHSGGLL